MAEGSPPTYKLVELVGVSSESYADATKNAVNRASSTLKGLGWFHVTELRGLIQDGEISESNDGKDRISTAGCRPTLICPQHQKKGRRQMTPTLFLGSFFRP